MRTTKKQLRCGQINEHGRQLIALFKLSEGTDPHALYYALRRIETRAHRRAEIQCSGPEHAVKNDEEMEQFDASILRSVHKLLGNKVPIIINGDPRGYALKIPDDWMREHGGKSLCKESGMTLHQDWGGYGILCPDFD